jgi:AcrR family transcriptional regulator
MAERGELTRQKLIDTALRLFRDDGYHATTMRRIATEAGVSLGNAYYYFASKDDLVHELYRLVQRDHRDRALPLLRPGAALSTNLRIALHAGLDVMAPYQGFGSTFVQVALPMSSTASPFSAESTAARAMAIDLMRQVVQTSRRRPPALLQDRLPTLLWLAYLAITLHWVSDRSPGQTHTRALVDRAAPLISRLVNLARLPGSGRLVAEVNALMDIASSESSVADAVAVSR